MADVLGAPDLGLDDDFFDHGGNSLLAMRLAARLRAAGHADIALRTVFESPTPAGIAARLATTSVASRPALRPLVPTQGDA